MRLTTKGRYAVTAMLDLALQEGKRPVTLHDIAVNQEISLSYLEQLFAKLRKAGLVRGTRGPGGGYRLAKKMDSISIAVRFVFGYNLVVLFLCFEKSSLFVQVRLPCM